MDGNYFDIETYSPNEKPNPKTDKIISIQFQKINIKTGEIKGELQILKEWESSEEEIVKEIYKWFFTRPWQFIPIGFNLVFEWQFLKEKFKQYNIECTEIGNFYTYPQIDLKFFAVIKKGGFLGASLSSISNKKDNGNVIKDFYEKKEFTKIEDYIKIETKSFIKCYKDLIKKIN